MPWILASLLSSALLAQAGVALPESELYVRVRLDAELPLPVDNAIHQQFSLCNAAGRCLPLFQFESELNQADGSGHFHQVEYFSYNRVEQAARDLGAPATAAFPEALGDFTVRVDSSLPGPRPAKAQGSFAQLFVPGTGAALRRQRSTSASAWVLPVPFASGARTLPLRAELTLLQTDTRDISPEFRAAPLPDAEAIFSRLRNYQVIFVTGADGFKARYLGEEYYDSFLKWLTAHGVENRRVIPGSNRPINEQAMGFEKLFNELSRSGKPIKPVIFVNYSSTNSNFAEFLLNHGENLKATRLLAGWIAVNASFVGNPLMEDVWDDPFQRAIAETLCPTQGLEDLRYVNRDAYLDANYDRILTAVRAVPTVITISSRINSTVFPSSRQARFLELDQRGLDNDGSTGTFSHFIPGSESISFDGTDHELLDKERNGYGADPYGIYLKLFARILDRAQAMRNP